MKILIVGYGNPGRQDDGLGAGFVEAVEQKHLEGVTVDSDYWKYEIMSSISLKV